MWWDQPRLKEFPPLLPPNILDVAARAYSVVEVGGLSGYGPERGRNFEALFYSICARRGVNLCEKAGCRTLAQQRSASGFGHEVDGATRSVDHLTHWELKHLTTDLDKNQLLVFNGKGMDFLIGSDPFFAKIPMLRFLLSGRNVGQESRYYSGLWGIMLLEPGRLPLPLLYEAVARGAGECLKPAELDAVKYEVAWACRPLQAVLTELSAWGNGTTNPSRCGPTASRHAREILDIQEELGSDVMDHLAEADPDWIDEIANDTWNEVGGW
jgi:hypothetical protein